GKDVEFLVSYRSAADADLKHVEMSIDVFAQSGQCMLIMNNEVTGVDFTEAPAMGRFRCRVSRFPLSPGLYSITLLCRVNGSIADWVQQAAVLTVEAGDFYLSGRLPDTRKGGFLVFQKWRVEETAGCPSSRCTEMAPMTSRSLTRPAPSTDASELINFPH